MIDEPVFDNWQGAGGVYSLMDHVLERFAGEFPTDPRVLVVGPAAEATDFGAIGSALMACRPLKKSPARRLSTGAADRRRAGCLHIGPIMLIFRPWHLLLNCSTALLLQQAVSHRPARPSGLFPCRSGS